MNKKDAAIEFIRCFCAADLQGMEDLLAPELKFTGPLFTFDSRQAYLESLQNDPPEQASYRLLSVTDNDDEVAIFYEYDKALDSMTLAQLFRFQGEQISEILLLFDVGKFNSG